jgi:hypothetical protein
MLLNIFCCQQHWVPGDTERESGHELHHGSHCRPGGTARAGADLLCRRMAAAGAENTASAWMGVRPRHSICESRWSAGPLHQGRHRPQSRPPAHAQNAARHLRAGHSRIGAALHCLRLRLPGAWVVGHSKGRLRARRLLRLDGRAAGGPRHQGCDRCRYLDRWHDCPTRA